MSDSIAVIDKNTFWELMAQAKAQCGQDLETEADWLRDRLMPLPPEQALRFDYMVHQYMKLSDKYGLWSAATVLAHGCTDDGFIDFRCWLMAQGREVFLTALKDPDSLADVQPYGDCCFESLCYVGDHVHERKTGFRTYQAQLPEGFQRELDDLARDIVYSPKINYPLEWHELKEHLPRLCAKYLTPEKLADNERQGPIWNHDHPEIRAARQHLPTHKKKNQQKGGDAR